MQTPLPSGVSGITLLCYPTFADPRCELGRRSLSRRRVAGSQPARRPCPPRPTRYTVATGSWERLISSGRWRRPKRQSNKLRPAAWPTSDRPGGRGGEVFPHESRTNEGGGRSRPLHRVDFMAGSTGLEPATSGLTVLNLNRRHLSPSQLVAISKAHGRSSAMLRPIASCCGTWVTISVTDA